MGDKILVLAQEEALYDNLAKILKEWGHQPLYAFSYGEFHETLFRQKPNFVILDDGFRKRNGLDLLRLIKDKHPWIETVILVENGDLEKGAIYQEQGASDFLSKPVSSYRLGIALKRAQERQQLRLKLAFLTGTLHKSLPPAKLAELGPEPDSNTLCQTRLYDAELKYRLLFNEVPCYISVLDEDFRITATNRRFTEDFGEQVGKHCFDAYLYREEECPNCPVAQTFRDGQSHQYEQVLTSLSGEQYNVLTWTAPLRGPTGEIEEVMTMSTNITQIRKLQDHLASLGMLIGSISHGMKGLVTALDGGMYSMRSGFKRNDPERIARGWEVVELMVGRIRSTVLDVLYYAKDRDLEVETVDVAQFARQVGFTGEYAAKKYKLSFQFYLGEDLGEFYVDPNALNPALVNIIENALDACLSDREKDDHFVIFKTTREDDVIVFDVEDNGMGMTEEVKEHMFTLFYTSKGSSGTGLGLFIANDTVAQHGGTITVDSEPGQGSHFHIRIPVRPRPHKPKDGDLKEPSSDSCPSN